MTEIGTGPAPVTAEGFAERINTAHRAASDAAQSALLHAREAGRLLVEAKATVGHGKWTGWLRDNVEFSERTARGYMRIAERWPELENRQRVAGLSLRSALKLLAGPGSQVSIQATAYLPEPDDEQPELGPWIPPEGHLAIGILPLPGGAKLPVWIVPSVNYPGHYYYTVLMDAPGKDSSVAEGGAKPVRPDWVARFLDVSHVALSRVPSWTYCSTEGWTYNEFVFDSEEDYFQRHILGKWNLATAEMWVQYEIQEVARMSDALDTVRECELYRETHDTFEDYCRDRWGLDTEALDSIEEVASP